MADFSAHKSGMGENWLSHKIYFHQYCTPLCSVFFFFFLCTELDNGGDLADFVHQVVTRLTVMSWSHWRRLLLPNRFPNRMWAVSVPVWEWPVYSVCMAVRRWHGLLGREWRDVLRWVCVHWCVWELKTSHLRITSAWQHNIRHCSDAWACLSWCAPRLQASVMPACDFPDPQLN